ncbi:hypothetical protein N665_0652s0006 [Sinapis alba]|nr:hypothetical protein N665_0652s0006 [Sinapis alba]
MTPEDAARQIDELEATVDEVHAQMKFLTGGYKRLAEASEATDKRLDSMDSSFQLLAKSIKKLTSVVQGTAPILQNQATSSQTVNQVNITQLGTNLEESQLGYRTVGSVLNNREGLLRKVEMPLFDGANPYSWIARTERFFRISQFDTQGKMELVSLSLEADALSWYNYEVEICPFVDWFDFKKRMLSRFVEYFEASPGKRLFGI